MSQDEDFGVVISKQKNHDLGSLRFSVNCTIQMRKKDHGIILHIDNNNNVYLIKRPY